MVVATKTPEAAAPEAGVEKECPTCLTANLGWLLAQAFYAFAAEQGKALAPLDVTPRQYCVMSSALSGEHTQIELAQLTGLDKTTMVVTLDELEEAGYAERRPSAHDRRARVVVVTKKGERKVAEARGVLDEVQNEILSTLPAGERRVFVDSLATLVRERLNEPVEDGPPMRRRQPKG
jgi:MarR family transcriptional regulator, transcriptional regulator for hemolysin